MRQYSVLATYYDKLNSGFDYDGYAGMAETLFKRNGVKPGDLVLDLACGTGEVTCRLARRGYDMIGADISPEMLDVARSKARSILWICQDMRCFELYGTVKAVVCCLDSVNYLLTREDLLACFSTVHNYLEPGGLFLFDVNTKRRFLNVYANRDYILEDGNVFCGWRNDYNEKTGVCDFNLTLFVSNNNSIERYDEHQRERCWSEKTLISLLKKAGFTEPEIYSDFDCSPATEGSERIFLACNCIK